jgi:hypothetical protein
MGNYLSVSSMWDTQIQSWRICDKKRLRGVHMGMRIHIQLRVSHISAQHVNSV